MVLSLLLLIVVNSIGAVGWAKARSAVPTNFAAELVGALRFAHPTNGSYFFTSGQREASSGWNASLPGTVAKSL